MTRLPYLIAILLISVPLAQVACGPSLTDDDDTAQGDDDDSVISDDDDSTPGGDDDDDTGDDDDDIQPKVEIEIIDAYPEAGATDVFVGTVLWVDFSGPTKATPSLIASDGTVVTGTTSWASATRAVFTPDSPLAFSTTYDASITWTDGSDAMQFTTSDLGSQPVDVDLTGSTYAWNMGSGVVISPQGGEALLGGGGDLTLLTGITGQHPGHLDIIGSLAEVDGATITQDVCVATSELSQPWIGDDDDSAGDDDDSAAAPSGGNWNDPAFSAGPADIQQRVSFPGSGELDLTLRDSVFSGTFVAVAAGSVPSTIVGGSFSANVDVRDTGYDCATALFIFPDLTCNTCPHDPAADECIQVWIVDVTADLVPGLTMVPRTEADITADLVCTPPS